jgi:arylsulfatase
VAYLAYADHEIGRVIQAVEDLGQLERLATFLDNDQGRSGFW